MPLAPPSVPSAIPRTILMLGLVSLFMDLSSELIHSLLPLFLVSTMHMSVTGLGALEGTAEGTTMIVRMFSGPLSDWLGTRKLLLVVGYGLAALTKPLFPLAGSPVLVSFARIVDRIGKGIRGAPRDALVADVAPFEVRGSAYGLRQSMDTIGAVFGPALATVLMLALADRIRAVLWFACVPALISVAVLVFSVREPERARGSAANAPRRFRGPLQWRAMRAFSRRFWFVVSLGALFSLARFSEAFLVLRAKQAGLDAAWVPSVMVAMNVAYALSAYPVGKWSDRLDRRIPLAAGLLLLIASDLVLGMHASTWLVFCGATLWGLHMGFTQGIFAAMVADVSPEALRGTAFGAFYLAFGVAIILASVLAGWLWDHFGAPATFFASAALVSVPLVMCAFAPRRG
ncbi:MAG TPA: MFS transporter [Trinickia sp.]|jgi:MFS family permease|nr:MFS transporter [Trinickia sp.]